MDISPCLCIKRTPTLFHSLHSIPRQRHTFHSSLLIGISHSLLQLQTPLPKDHLVALSFLSFFFFRLIYLRQKACKCVPAWVGGGAERESQADPLQSWTRGSLSSTTMRSWLELKIKSRTLNWLHHPHVPQFCCFTLEQAAAGGKLTLGPPLARSFLYV